MKNLLKKKNMRTPTTETNQYIYRDIYQRSQIPH